jgi:hypothetical protein
MSGIRILFCLMNLLVFVACSSGDKTPPEEIIQTVYPDSLLAWRINPDSMIMIKDTMVPDSAITISRIINGLNQSYPGVHVNFIKQSNDTAFVEIPDASYLGEQMGDAGASAWFADATINLTSIKAINFVSFKMDQHSHAGSTVIGKEKFKDWKKQ